ncbi:MAG: VCBS repeat-containing protein [Planctomycetes bacterium]|nr:VCBS repeat-containing protein [Planctomycetota bacterium]
MRRRLEWFGLILSFVVASSATSRAAEPDLKAGVRLSFGGARTHGQAAPEIADWNSDGLNDVIVGHRSGALFVYLNRGFDADGLVFERVPLTRQDTFASGGTPIWAWRFNKANCVCPGPGRISPRVVDWNADGKKDLIIGDGRGAQTRVWKNVGTNAKPIFSTHHLQYLPPDGGVRPYHETVQPCIADWNADGKTDLIMGRNRGVYVYLNVGSDKAPQFDFDRSRLGSKIDDVFPDQRLSPVVVDWDGDGRQDLLLGSQGGEVWFARNVGSKSAPKFSDYGAVEAGGENVEAASEARIAVGDLDGDGLADLLVGDGTGLVRFYQARQPAALARSRQLKFKRGSQVAVELIGTDDAGRKLTFEVKSKPAHGVLTGTAPKLIYTPESGFTGRDQLTFVVLADGQKPSKPATITIAVEAPDSAPTIVTAPADQLVAPGQPVRIEVTAKGTAPFSFQWKKNGEAIAKATGSSYSIRKAAAEDGGEFSVTVKNGAGEVTSSAARLQVKPLPGPQDNVPVVSLKFESPVVEPETSGVLVLSRTGKLDTAVSVKLTSRRGHNPVIADLHYVPLPESIELNAGETSRRISVTPINDTLVTGPESLTFQIVPNPAYRVAAGSVRMPFLDDDCPTARLSIASSESGEKGEQAFVVTAEPPPARDTEVSYSIGGTAMPGVD